ncbi:hypothetical protein [Frigidibacter sp. MR17.24]|uniref:hypothetical protein n=1 Tax=Frigidibacter sp. MR17.24 TaxID=3127345 RepID=UPI003012B845
MLFTPHTLVGFLSGPAFGLWIFDATTLLCMLVGSLCLYKYTLHRGSLPSLAAIGAIVFMLGGYGSSRLQHVPQIISFALLPVLLLSFRHCVRTPNVGTVLCLSAVGALLALNPNQVVFLSPFFLMPLLVAEVKGSQRIQPALVGLLISFVLVSLIAAPSLSAILETVELSTRTRLDLSSNAPASLPGFSAWSSILPGAFGARLGHSEHWGPVDATEGYLYVGIIPLGVVLLSMSRRQAPSRLLGLAWGMALLSFLFAMGTKGPLFPLLYERVPGFSLFRRPSDGVYFLMLYASLAVAFASLPGSSRDRGWIERLALPCLLVVLSAVGAASLIRFAAEKSRLSLLQDDFSNWLLRAALASVLIGGAYFLTGRAVRGPLMGFLGLGLTLVDLTTAGRITSFSERYERYELAEAYRILAGWDQFEWQREAESLKQIKRLMRAGERVEVVGGSAMNAPMALGLAMSQGYNPLVLKRYADVFGAQHLGYEPKTFTALAASPYSEPHRWLGVRYYLLHGYILDNPSDFGAFGAAVVGLRDMIVSGGGAEIQGGGTYRIYEVPATYPEGTLLVGTGDERSPSVGQCRVLVRAPGYSRYECSSDKAALFITGDSFAPGWTACVGERSAPVEPFLGVLRSLELPPGTNAVTIRYQPVPFLRFWDGC